MKKLLMVILLSAGLGKAFAQLSPDKIIKLKKHLSTVSHDTTKIRVLTYLASGFRFSDADSCFIYVDRALKLNDAVRAQYPEFAKRMRAEILSLKGATLLETGKLPESLQFQFEALKLAEEAKDKDIIGAALNRIGNTYMELADYQNANLHYFKSLEMFEANGNTGMYYNELSNIGNIYNLRNMPDSAFHYLTIVYQAQQKSPKRRASFTVPELMFRMGNTYKLKGDQTRALAFYKRGIAEAKIDNDIRNLTMNSLLLATLYDELNQRDSAIHYAQDAIRSGKAVKFRKGVYDASLLLSQLYAEGRDSENAHHYLQMAMVEKDSLMGAERFKELQKILLEENKRQRRVETESVAKENRLRQNILLAGIAVFLVIAGILYRSNRRRHNANIKLERAYATLKSTQSKLVHSEKMASLGELTAGVAHEIQNPLNFVNNFADVSRELVEEIKEERAKSKDSQDDALVDEILSDIDQNLEKIHYHGKRADAIVKGMLQHSRATSGEKEPTDLNALADEYLRLAYHGLRAKDKSFNAELVTNFAENLPKVDAVPQDLGRVFLNLFTNAFYATQKRKKSDDNFKPVVQVTTAVVGNSVQIRIIDNGIGISESVKEKIFQPFFTTKPTGEGTGLGLSMSYDIAKAHNGSIEVDSEEGKSTTFIVSIPIK